MAFWRSIPGAIVLVLLLGAVAVAGAVGFQVWNVVHPERKSDPGVTLATELSRVENVSFKASDGVDLEGWLFRGSPDGPVVVLCHDLDETKASLVNVAISLHKLGFTILAFDFRGHGQSGGNGSTLGILEKRDVLGAVDFLGSQEHADVRRIGIYGTGMGAHAAVLASADRGGLKVLVLDGLYPDAGYPLVRRTFLGWSFGVKWLGFLPKAAFSLLTPAGVDSARAQDILPNLMGREMLLVAPAGDTALASAMQRMYDSIPQSRDGSEINLITLPATRASGLYGPELERYHARVGEFFESRLAPK